MRGSAQRYCSSTRTLSAASRVAVPVFGDTPTFNTTCLLAEVACVLIRTQTFHNF